MYIIFIIYLLSLFDNIYSHGAVVYPKPRNSIDSNLSPWSGKVPSHIPGVDGWCPVSLEKNILSGRNGQACFWFSNGCSIGCKTCDSNTRGPIPNRPGWNHKMDVCGLHYKATICDSKYRTVNTDAKCGADNDYQYYSPWRAPGSSGVLDSCGVAGGRNKPGGFGAQYINTPHAKQGDYGSKTLPYTNSYTKWKQGGAYEVSWTIQANHGGGYQYRLCPRDQELNEECFNKIPLDFVGKQYFRWDGIGKDSKLFAFDGTYVTEGTIPKGSMWAMNPIPRNDTTQTGKSFKPRCNENPDCGSTSVQSKCKCSGMWGPQNLEIVDYVKIPIYIPVGEYVLGWRWDCEESNQIWTSCSDVSIVAGDDKEDENL